MIFDKVSADQINSVHRLFLFLHRLKVIGTVSTKTIRIPSNKFEGNRVYSLVYGGYDRSQRGLISLEDRIHSILR